MTTLSHVAEEDKKIIFAALDGKVIVGFDGDEPLFGEGTKEQCTEAVIEIFEGWYYKASKGYAAARAYENIVRDTCGLDDRDLMFRFMKEMEKELYKYDTYIYESVKQELVEEAEEVLNETD